MEAQATGELPLADRPTDLVGVRACAAALQPKVSPSTISRQLAASMFKNYGTAEAPLISLAEVREARANRLNPALQRAAPQARAGKQGDGYHAARTEREQYTAAIAKLDLAERLGQLLPRDQYESAMADLGRRVREELAQMIRAEIPALEEIEGVEARIAHMTQKLEGRLTALSDEFDAKGDGNEPDGS